MRRTPKQWRDFLDDPIHRGLGRGELRFELERAVSDIEAMQAKIDQLMQSDRPRRYSFWGE